MIGIKASACSGMWWNCYEKMNRSTKKLNESESFQQHGLVDDVFIASSSSMYRTVFNEYSLEAIQITL